MKKVIFRADGNEEIGLGHVLRSLSLAEMLKEHFTLIFAVRTPSNFLVDTIERICDEIMIVKNEEDFIASLNVSNIVVLDGYYFDTEYQIKVKETGCKLVCIDDIAEYDFVADVIINHGPNANKNMYHSLPGTKYCLGLEYALIKKTFLIKKRNKIDKASELLIIMGGADKFNLTLKVLEAAVRCKYLQKIYVVLGSGNVNEESISKMCDIHPEQIIILKNLKPEEIAETFFKCQLVICQGSSVAIEAASIGLGILCGYYIDNQLTIYNGLVRNNMVMPLGNLLDISNEDLLFNINRLVLDIKQINFLINNQNRFIDGKSPARLLNVFKKLAA